ncbi:MAG: WYL domain-containing protein [Clostridiaceae bacterium]|nr:WYL domain-containing protein [Clostridiaceae bacterium]
MAGSPNQKLKLLYLMKILLEHSDEEHPLSMQDMIEALATHGISAERKSIYSDLELLRSFGLDIELKQSKTFGYYVASRNFELPELKLLGDAVQSSRLITQKKSEELLRKLADLTSTHQAKRLHRQVYIADRPKNLNESVYYSIDAINDAINSKRQICFKYFDYDVNKKRVYRGGGKIYQQTPLALCWADDNYYLISYNANYDSLNHYRVDRISKVEISDEPAAEIAQDSFNVAEHAKKVFGMFSGELVNAELVFDRNLVNIVIDRFGKDVYLIPEGERFRIHAEVSINPVFLSWMFQFGRQAEIRGPERLREAMAQLLRENSQMYDT